MSQNRLFVWKSHWKWLDQAHKLGGAGSQGITRVKQTVRARLVETQTRRPPASCVGGELGKGTITSTSTSVLEKDAPSARFLKPDSAVPHHMSLVPFKLLRCTGAQAERVGVRPCLGPLKGMLGLQKPTISLSHNPPCFCKYLLMYCFLEREDGRQRNVNVLFHLFMNSLADSCMCPDQELNPQPWHIRTKLSPTKQPNQGFPTVLYNQ